MVPVLTKWMPALVPDTSNESISIGNQIIIELLMIETVKVYAKRFFGRPDEAAKAKKDKYSLVYKQVEALVEGEDDTIANMSNIAALLHTTFGFWWTGFYIVRGDELVLGPFQGPVACSRIPFGRGVCGTSWQRKESIVVPDVEKFPGHIACSSQSRSEIVVPIFRGEEVIAVLDIDSRELNAFDDIDRESLEKIAKKVR